MYRLNVRDHIMVAHSLPAESFGPAQQLHGATYVVDCCWSASELGPDAVVLDIGAGRGVLRGVLDELDYRNLDDLPAFAGRLTTTEFLCRWIAEKVAEDAPAHVREVRVTLHEHPDAWASYTHSMQ